jgi:hypothetical protein
MALENPQNHLFFKIKQGGVSHHGLAIYILKVYLEAKEEL